MDAALIAFAHLHHRCWLGKLYRFVGSKTSESLRRDLLEHFQLLVLDSQPVAIDGLFLIGCPIASNSYPDYFFLVAY